jgi:plasmid stabilization system protein ParE
MKIRILRLALEDLAEGRLFYEAQQQGVGDYFLDSLFTEIDSLVLHAGIHSLHFSYHRLLANRFPFAVYYRVIRDEVLVYRVLDCRSDPRSIRLALEKSE